MEASFQHLLKIYPSLIDFNVRLHKEHEEGFNYMVVDIYSLDELLNLQKSLGEDVIIGEVWDSTVKKIEKQILIYDGYIE